VMGWLRAILAVLGLVKDMDLRPPPKDPPRYVDCKNCKRPISVHWSSEPPAGPVWDVDRCPYCGWSALDG